MEECNFKGNHGEDMIILQIGGLAIVVYEVCRGNEDEVCVWELRTTTYHHSQIKRGPAPKDECSRVWK